MFSKSVYLVWQIAANEAGYAGCNFIEPEHILIGLCSLEKLQFDQNTPSEVIIEKKYLDDVFQTWSLSPSKLRRKLRDLIGDHNFHRSGEVIHRSPEVRELFGKAEQLGNNNLITCRELLISIIRAPNKNILSAFSELQIDISELLSHAESKFFDKESLRKSAPNQNLRNGMVSNTPQDARQ